VKPSEDVTPFLAPLAALQRLISYFEERGVIIGGIAASLLGKPRLTADIDAMLLLGTGKIPDLIEASQKEDLLPRIDNAAEFARKHRVLLLRHRGTGTNIDISLGILPFEEEVVARSIVLEVAGLFLRLPTPEDLIIFKAVAHRPKDLVDIQSIMDSHPDLDRKRIESWVRQFAEALEMPELWDDLARLFE
jgi:hypothetical protein